QRGRVYAAAALCRCLYGATRKPSCQGTAAPGRMAAFAALFSPSAFMTKALATKPVATETVTKTAASAPQREQPQTDSSGPVWKTQQGRVQGAMWRYSQKDGKTRYTVSISRSYKDEKEKWQNVHYFDRRDLADVRKICDEAEQQVLNLEGMTQVAGED